MKNNKTFQILVISILSFNSIAFFVPVNVSAQTENCLYLKNTLRVGSRDIGTNGEVTKLQNFLKSNGHMTINATGYFGNLTATAVKNFQSKENLPIVGQVGPLTRTKINTMSCVAITPSQPIIPTTPTAPVTPTPVAPVSTAKKLPYTSTKLSDWIIVWGNSSITAENNLALKATETTNGGQILLSESNEWTDYVFSANIFVKQATVTLISRYVDENNFLGCTFSGRYVEIFQRIGGKSTVVASSIVPDAPYSNYFYNDLNLSMSVNGKTVGCSLLGSESNVSWNTVDGKLLKGGIGIQTWANAIGVASVELRGVKVTSI